MKINRKLDSLGEFGIYSDNLTMPCAVLVPLDLGFLKLRTPARVQRSSQVCAEMLQIVHFRMLSD